MKTIAVLTIAAAAVGLAGCGSDSQPEGRIEPTATIAAAATPTPNSSMTAPSASPVPTKAEVTADQPSSVLRMQTCRDILPLLDQLRSVSAEAARQSAEDTISNLPQTPEWPTLSESDRQATIAGIRDAAGGTC